MKKGRGYFYHSARPCFIQFLILAIKKAQSFSFSVLCVLGGFCSHGSSNPFGIGKYPFFIFKIEHKNFALKKRKSLEKSRLFAAISFLSPFAKKESCFEPYSYVAQDRKSALGASHYARLQRAATEQHCSPR